MVVLNILRRQKEKLLGPQVTVNIKEPYDENESPFACTCNSCAYLFLFLSLGLMVTVIFMSGMYLFDEYREPDNLRRFRGGCNIPIDKQELIRISSMKLVQNIEEEMRNIENFHEDFEIYMDEDRASVDVPDFRDGRGGRFIHDFRANLTGIIDMDGKRCFIMPLNRTIVLPPHSLIDMISKMDSGYYDVNMNLIKQNMVAVQPPLRDYSNLSIYIIKECISFDIYQLEKINRTVVKRSAKVGEKTKFMEFAGNFLQEIDIVNLNDLKGAAEPTAKLD